MNTYHETPIVNGSIVQLRAGGVYMTVERIAGDEVHCVWFVNDEVRRSAFALVTLKNTEDIRMEDFII